MIASKRWGQCQCGCDKPIEPGDNFVIIDGRFCLHAHEDHTGMRREIVAGSFGRHVITKLVDDQTLTDEVKK